MSETPPDPQNLPDSQPVEPTPSATPPNTPPAPASSAPAPAPVQPPTVEPMQPVEPPAEPPTNTQPINGSNGGGDNDDSFYANAPRGSWTWIMWGALLLVVVLIVTVLAWRIIISDKPASAPVAEEIAPEEEVVTEPAPAEESAEETKTEEEQPAEAENTDLKYQSFSHEKVDYTFDYIDGDGWSAEYITEKSIPGATKPQTQVDIKGPNNLFGTIFRQAVEGGFQGYTWGEKTIVKTKDGLELSRYEGPSNADNTYGYLIHGSEEDNFPNSFSAFFSMDSKDEDALKELDKLFGSIKLK